MSQKYKAICARRGVGEVSSKYGYPDGGEQFERDIALHAAESEALYAEFVDWMKSRLIAPDTVRSMFVRFYYEFCHEEVNQ